MNTKIVKIAGISMALLFGLMMTMPAMSMTAVAEDGEPINEIHVTGVFRIGGSADNHEIHGTGVFRIGAGIDDDVVQGTGVFRIGAGADEVIVPATCVFRIGAGTGEIIAEQNGELVRYEIQSGEGVRFAWDGADPNCGTGVFRIGA